MHGHSNDLRICSSLSLEGGGSGGYPYIIEFNGMLPHCFSSNLRCGSTHNYNHEHIHYNNTMKHNNLFSRKHLINVDCNIVSQQMYLHSMNVFV